jgi:hypothetical protein
MGVRQLDDLPSCLVVIEAGGIRLLDKRRFVGSNPTYHYFLPGNVQQIPIMMHMGASLTQFGTTDSELGIFLTIFW